MKIWKIWVKIAILAVIAFVVLVKINSMDRAITNHNQILAHQLATIKLLTEMVAELKAAQPKYSKPEFQTPL